jgi:hypothetical protein
MRNNKLLAHEPGVQRCEMIMIGFKNHRPSMRQHAQSEQKKEGRYIFWNSQHDCRKRKPRPAVEGAKEGSDIIVSGRPLEY